MQKCDSNMIKKGAIQYTEITPHLSENMRLGFASVNWDLNS